MKVLLTATVQSHVAQFHRPLAAVLHRHGCEVHVAACDNLAEKNGLKLDFADKVYDVPFARSPRSLDNLKAYMQLRRILQSETYDVIHCNTPMGGIVTRLATKNVRKRGTKVFYTAHGFHFYRGAPRRNWLLFYPVERYFARYTDKLITITTEDANLARRHFSCPVEFIHGVGVDERRYHPISSQDKILLKQSMGFNQKQRIILCVGELLPNKNQQMGILAMKQVITQVPDAVLLLAGNGKQKTVLEQLIAELGLQQHIRLLGYCTNLEEYQRIADVAISCSRREGLPLNIVEAMLSETPVVATRNRGHNELLCEGKHGILINQDAPENMAEGILQILSNKQMRNDLVMAAALFAKQYTFDNVEKELGKIYFPEE